MAGIVDPGQVGLALMPRIAEGHIVAVGVFHPVQTPPKDLGRIIGMSHARRGGLAEIKLRAGRVRGQKVWLAVAGRQLLHPREPAFHLGPVFVGPGIHQLHVDAGEPKDIGIARIIQAEFGLPVDHPFFQVPTQAHPAVTTGAGIDQGQVGLDPAPARRHVNGNAGGGRAGEQVGMHGPAHGSHGHVLIRFLGNGGRDEDKERERQGQEGAEDQARKAATTCRQATGP